MPTDHQSPHRACGYIIERILSDDELEHYRAAAEPMYQAAAANAKDRPSAHALSRNVFDPPGDLAPFYPLACHPRVLALAEELMGPRIVLDNAVFYMNTPGRTYKQRWHRDTLQIPADLRDARWFTPDVFFNCLQINLPLYDDASFWIVPGSHNRPYTDEERAVFGDVVQTDPDTVMPGGVAVELKAGYAALYNNNMIHRGFNQARSKRVTFHANYHSDAHPPTWHFYSPGFRLLTPEQAADLPPELHEIWIRNQETSRLYPDVRTSYTCP